MEKKNNQKINRDETILAAKKYSLLVLSNNRYTSSHISKYNSNITPGTLMRNQRNANPVMVTTSISDIMLFGKSGCSK